MASHVSSCATTGSVLVDSNVRTKKFNTRGHYLKVDKLSEIFGRVEVLV